MPEQFLPIRLFVTLLVLIFCIEGAIMFALDNLLILLTQALKRKVIAEGVETEEQARLLRLLRCDQMQG